MIQPFSHNWQISSTELHLHLGSKKLTINILPWFLIYSREEKSLPSFIDIPSFCGWRDVLAQLSVKAGLLNILWVMSSSRSPRKETPPPLLVPSTNVAFEQDCMSPCSSHPDSKPSRLLALQREMNLHSPGPAVLPGSNLLKELHLFHCFQSKSQTLTRQSRLSASCSTPTYLSGLTSHIPSINPLIEAKLTFAPTSRVQRMFSHQSFLSP